MAATAVTVDRGRQQFGGIFSDIWKVKATIDFASVLNAAKAVDTVAVPGVALGDVVIAVSLGVDVVDLALDAQVTAANEVSVVAVNATGGTVDLASTTIKLVVARPNF